jgi:hypothetical protein
MSEWCRNFSGIPAGKLRGPFPPQIFFLCPVFENVSSLKRNMENETFEFTVEFLKH